MDGNSPKPTETVEGTVLALAALRAWIEEEGGNQRIPQVLDLLAARTAANLAAGHQGPALDAETLRELYFDRYGGRVPPTPATRWLSSSNIRRWWEQRRARIEHACREAGVEITPSLVIQLGGGRNNVTQYRLDIRPLPAPAEEASLEQAEATSTVATEDANQVIRYTAEPAQPVWWLGLIIGTEPFRMRSWRGYALIGWVIVDVLLLALLWWAVLVPLNAPRPIWASDLLSLILATAITVAVLRGLLPIIRLPNDRVTLASDPYLSWNQFHGQFRLTRDAKSKVAGGWFRLVRHWGYCSMCSGEVEIQSGGHAFPSRLVGRCTDSPLEHVFSFDPVSLTGIRLH